MMPNCKCTMASRIGCFLNGKDALLTPCAQLALEVAVGCHPAAAAGGLLELVWTGAGARGLRNFCVRSRWRCSSGLPACSSGLHHHPAVRPKQRVVGGISNNFQQSMDTGAAMGCCRAAEYLSLFLSPCNTRAA